MHAYRTHTCGALRSSDADAQVRLSGWVHRKRDHGNLVFLDLRDHYGLTQCVIAAGSPIFDLVESLRPESVVTITGTVLRRTADTVNAKLATGEIEVHADALIVQSTADVLPLQVAGDAEYPEDTRLRYRFLDLRRDRLHQNIDTSIADLATFTRHAWGNAKDAVKAATLSEVRKELADRDTVFTSGELEKAYP